MCRVGSIMSVEMATWFPSEIAASLFFAVCLIWAASEVFNTIGIQRIRHIPGAVRRDRGSCWVIAVTMWGSIVVSLLARAMNLGIFQNDLQYLGLILATFGVAFREWAVLSLGRYFAVAITIYPDQKLTKRGPYRWLRHPSYSGSILSLVGFPLSLGTWAGAVLVLGLSLAAYLYRVKLEESALIEAFGDDYREYMEHTWRLFPGL